MVCTASGREPLLFGLGEHLLPQVISKEGGCVRVCGGGAPPPYLGTFCTGSQGWGISWDFTSPHIELELERNIRL